MLNKAALLFSKTSTNIYEWNDRISLSRAVYGEMGWSAQNEVFEVGNLLFPTSSGLLYTFEIFHKKIIPWGRKEREGQSRLRESLAAGAGGGEDTQQGVKNSDRPSRSQGKIWGLSLGPCGQKGGTWACLAHPLDSVLSGNPHLGLFDIKWLQEGQQLYKYWQVHGTSEAIKCPILKFGWLRLLLKNYDIKMEENIYGKLWSNQVKMEFIYWCKKSVYMHGKFLNPVKM